MVKISANYAKIFKHTAVQVLQLSFLLLACYISSVAKRSVI